MKKLMEWIKSYAMTYAVDYLKNNKEEIVSKLNKKIDVKFLSESQEQKLLESCYEVVLEVFDDKDTSK
tara:strand:+ start:3660 stop:3863 length:204 start_codon:yes stop_codon:yes gene_type:complete